MKSSFILYTDIIDVLDALTDEQKGQLFYAIVNYERTGESPVISDPVVRIAFIPVKQQLDRMSEDYHEPIRQNRSTSAYREWRMCVLNRDQYTCQICGVRDSDLHVHHIKPYAYYPDLRLDVDNGITLCADCHRNVHRGWGNFGNE